MNEELKILANLIKEEIRTSKEFQARIKKDIEKLNYDSRYYEGQVDALNLTLTKVENNLIFDVCQKQSIQLIQPARKKILSSLLSRSSKEMI